MKVTGPDYEWFRFEDWRKTFFRRDIDIVMPDGGYLEATVIPFGDKQQ